MPSLIDSVNGIPYTNAMRLLLALSAKLDKKLINSTDFLFIINKFLSRKTYKNHFGLFSDLTNRPIIKCKCNINGKLFYCEISDKYITMHKRKGAISIKETINAFDIKFFNKLNLILKSHMRFKCKTKHI